MVTDPITPSLGINLWLAVILISYSELFYYLVNAIRVLFLTLLRGDHRYLRKALD